MVLPLIEATTKNEGFAVTATGTDNGDGYLRDITFMVECTGSSCDGVCSAGTCWSGFLSGRQGEVNHDLVLVHGSLLLVSWAFLAPMAFIIKRNPTTLLDLSVKVCGYPLAFLLHAILMLTSVVFTITGVLIALIGFDRRALLGHFPIGVVVFCVVVFQPIPALFCRPEHGEPRRKYFNWIHWAGGGIALSLGAVNVILGTMNYKTLWSNCIAPSFIGCAAAGIGFCVVVFVVTEILRRRQEGGAHVEQHDSGAEMAPASDQSQENQDAKVSKNDEDSKNIPTEMQHDRQ